jgi:hypothetical protein
VATTREFAERAAGCAGIVAGVTVSREARKPGGALLPSRQISWWRPWRRRASDEMPVPAPVAPATDDAVEYARRVYASTLDWYKIADTKAQLLLTINGIFVTILSGALLGKVADVRALGDVSGPETWVFFLVAVVGLAGAITCAARCLWSRLGRIARDDFAHLDVDPDDPATYRPEVLWFFGRLARLPAEPAAEMLRHADRGFEIKALTYDVMFLARNVLRKHQWVNAGWTFTAVALLALLAGGTSFVIRVHP